MAKKFAICGVAKFSVTEVALVAVADVTTGAPAVNSFGFAFSMLKVNATSLAVNGLPSLHSTPARTGVVTDLPSADQVGWPDASIGFGFCVGTMLLKMYRGSLTSPIEFTV